MVLPTESGFYEDAVGSLWFLRDDGQWEYLARRLPFGGLTTADVDHRPIAAEQLARVAPYPDAELLPLTRVEIEDVPPALDS